MKGKVDQERINYFQCYQKDLFPIMLQWSNSMVRANSKETTKDFAIYWAKNISWLCFKALLDTVLELFTEQSTSSLLRYLILSARATHIWPSKSAHVQEESPKNTASFLYTLTFSKQNLFSVMFIQKEIQYTISWKIHWEHFLYHWAWH